MPAPTPTGWKPPRRCAAAPATGRCRTLSPNDCARPMDLDADGLIVVASNRPAGAVGGVDTRWAAVTLDGRRSAVVGHGGRPVPRSSPHSSSRRRTATGAATWRSGSCCRAGRCSACSTVHWSSPSLTCSLRKQFGQPLSAFQGVQFQLTDAEVERSGLEMLAKYALWSVGSGRPEALEDALALRMSAIEAAEVVFRVTPPAARRGRILRRDHAVLAVPLQPAAASATARACPRPATSLTGGSAAGSRRPGPTGLYA